MKSGFFGATLALFAMMFGAGNIVFPILLGEYAGSSAPWAIVGFGLGGVAIPFLGLIAMMYYEGDYRGFFGRIGQKTGFGLYLFLILILGPIGSIPRLITVSFGTMKPYLPEMSLVTFSAIACSITLLFALRKTRILGLLAYGLTPILLVSLGVIIGRGLGHDGIELAAVHSVGASFGEGLQLGYSLLDLFAAFLYSTLVLNDLRRRGGTIHTGIWASILAGALLMLVYAGLTYVGAYHGAAVRGDGSSEEMVRAVSVAILGPAGGLVACVAVGLACLTTAVSLTVVCSGFLQDELLKGRGGYMLPIAITLGLSFVISTLGFTGIAALIGPLLQLIHPALILLCILNIIHRQRRARPIRGALFAVLALTAFLQFAPLQ